MSLLVEDRALLDAFRRGDRAALTRVYEHYAEDVARMLANGFSFSSAGSRSRFRGYASRFDLEDVLHEVFARVFSDRVRLHYDGLTPFRNYLFLVVRSVVVDDFRAKQRLLFRFTMESATSDEATENPGEPLDGWLETTGDPERDLEAAELTALVQEFRKSLAPDEEQVFRLRFAEGKSLAEVETETGRSPSQVKTLERKLRHRILERIWRSGYLASHVSGTTPREGGGWIARIMRSIVKQSGGTS